jgi:hypothetical protein
MEADGTPNAEELLRHLEAALGALDLSRTVGEELLREEDAAEFGVVALGDAYFATFGISRHRLDDEGEPVAQELTVNVSDSDFAVNLLSTLGRHVLGHHRALAAGERHRTPGWNEASSIQGVMAVPDPLVAPFEHAMPPVRFMRLVPITDSEAAYAGEHGWEALAEEFALHAADIADLFRKRIV